MRTKIRKNGSDPSRAVCLSGDAGGGEALRRKQLDKDVEAIECAYLSSARFSIKDLSARVLEAAQKATGSNYGFAAYIDPHTGWMIAPTLSRDVWKGRLPPGKPLVFKKFGGLWGWALKNKRPILTNAAASDPRSGGTPPGHIKIIKFLAAPAISSKKLAGIIALANPARDYGPEDLAAVKRLARVYAIIIQRKLAEDRIKESEEQYRAMINASQDIIYTINLDGRLTYVSGQAANYGYSSRAMVGRHVMEFTHPDDRYLISQALAKAVKTGLTHSMLHYRIKKKDGSYFQAEQKTGIIFKDGKPFMFAGVIRDVTERDRLRNRVVENEETLRRIFDTATDAIFIKDLQSRYVKANTACAGLFGLTPDELAGKSDFDIMPAELAQKLNKQDRLVVKKNTRLVSDSEIRTAKGEIRTFNSIKVPLYDAAGRVTGLLGVSRDVTELKKLQRQLIETKAIEAVSKIARPAAHDFNNILSAINGYATLIMETLKTGNPVKPEIEQILNAVKRAASITRRLQTYGSKTEN
jgi:PAS domain S-box-containing protein